jgi:hypothetical protein
VFHSFLACMLSGVVESKRAMLFQVKYERKIRTPYSRVVKPPRRKGGGSMFDMS